MKKVYFLCSLFLLLFSLDALAQDKIYKKGGEIIDVKVVEVGTNEIKYTIPADINGPVYALDKSRIIKVVYQNGRTETFQHNLKDPKLYADQTKSAVKANFLAPLFGYTQLNFEHNIRPGKSYELALGIIGLGKRQLLYYSDDTYRDAKGVFLGAGYKFSKIPDFINNTEKYSHVLQGFYTKPELVLGIYGQNAFDYNSSQTERITTYFGALMLNGGKQWVLGDIFLIDIYLGLGYAFDGENNSEYGAPENHFALIGGGDSGFGFTSGIKVGLLLNKKKNKLIPPASN